MIHNVVLITYVDVVSGLKGERLTHTHIHVYVKTKITLILSNGKKYYATRKIVLRNKIIFIIMFYKTSTYFAIKNSYKKSISP